MKRTNSVYKHTILVNDPSMTAWGWVIMSYDSKILEMGCIKTEKAKKKLRIRVSDDNTKRISEVNKILLEKIKKWNVNYIISELQHGSQSAVAAKWQGAVTAIGQTIADTLDIGIEWYSEGDSKKCLLGKQSATKQETIDAIDKLYNVPWTHTKYIDEAIADALSVHYVASKQSSTLKLFKNQ
jgi:Holliday junction resolvasome RuvABC endonuclease subunit